MAFREHSPVRSERVMDVLSESHFAKKAHLVSWRYGSTVQCDSSEIEYPSTDGNEAHQRVSLEKPGPNR